MLSKWQLYRQRNLEKVREADRIRKSKSLTEISALVAALITLSVIEPKAKKDDEEEQILTEVNVAPSTIGEVANEVPKDEN